MKSPATKHSARLRIPPREDIKQVLRCPAADEHEASKIATGQCPRPSHNLVNRRPMMSPRPRSRPMLEWDCSRQIPHKEIDEYPNHEEATTRVYIRVEVVIVPLPS